VGILTDDMKRVVTEQRLGFMATVCPDGTPNVSPKGTTAVFDDDHLVFADLRSPQTIRNIAANPSIEINVVDQLVRKGYRFKGTATVHKDDDIFERALELYMEIGLGDYRDRIKGVVLVKVDRAVELTSPVYDLGRTEAEVRADYIARLRRQIGDVGDVR
jgi:predicted pyridoxine 5'-phosphate oxidase superfamily flavin-nucleotide-binding protein